MQILNFHAIIEYLENPHLKGILYIVSGQTKNDWIKKINPKNIELRFVTKSDIKKLNNEARNFLLDIQTEKQSKKNTISSIKDFLKKNTKSKLILLLDKIQDPHNLGAILRSAEQFGVDLVILPHKNAVKNTPIVASTSVGAIERVPILWGANLHNCILELKKRGFWIVGAAMNGKVLQDFKNDSPLALVLGNEGQGISSLLQKSCDEMLAIPQKSQSHIDSLNVSVAAGIFLYALTC